MESAETLLQAKTPKIDHNQSQHTLNNGINNESNKSSGTDLEQGKVYKFPISPLTRFSGQCVTYKLPIEITCFSYDGERKLHHDDRELKYYYPPDLRHCDLSQGYETYIKRENMGSEPIHPLLDLLNNIRNTSNDPDLTKIDLISWRGIFTKILCTPYNRNEPWELGATLYNDTIYIEEHETEYSKENSSGKTSRQQLMSYWGYKFESLCTVTKPPYEIDDAELINRKTNIVNSNSIYCSVAKTCLGNHKIIMGAEIDCLSDPKPPNPQNPVSKYIELKTSKIIENDKDNYTFERYKLMKFWTQSFLIGVPKIIVGFRDNNGFLQSIQEFKTLEIPTLVRTDMWDATVCLNFANKFFEWLKTVVIIDNPRSSYTISFEKPFREIHVTFAGEVNPVLADRHIKPNV